MKISYRTHPVLEKLNKKSLGDINVYACDVDSAKEYLNTIKHRWSEDSKKPHKIYYLTQTFIDAYELAADKLMISNLWKDVKSQNICFILPSGQATYLDIRNEPGGFIDDTISTHYYDFLNNTIIGYSTHETTYGHLKTGQSPERRTFFNLTDDISLGFESKNVTNVEQHIFNCILLTLFIEYAEVETKELLPNSRIKDIRCKYINDTKCNVIVLDSSWITNLVKSDGFDVRGHFRVQPFKEKGLWNKKLIWINPFRKTGYTAPARKLKEAV